MKILPSVSRKNAAQILAEACIGLSLMVFAWILITYSLYLANNQLRTEMAARYAAWYTGNNNGTPPTTAQIDQYFFFQSGLSGLSTPNAAGIGDVITGTMPSGTATYGGSDGSSGNGPFKIEITFGVASLDTTTNPFPFSIVSTGVSVPFMPTNTLSVFSVNSSCQWDGDSDTWTSASSALAGVWNSLTSAAGSL
jgi:hypothetical protein